MTLFCELPDNAHDAYRALFDPQSRQSARARELCDAHWQQFRHLADRDFEREFAVNFYSRWFEMNLGVVLLELGLDVAAPKPGPDFLVRVGDLRVWIEAVTPSSGDPLHPDAVPDPQYGKARRPIAGFVPAGRVALRIAHAVRQKIDRFDAYARDGLIAAGDCRLIAVSLRDVHYAFLHHDEFMKRALYGLGDLTVTFNVDDPDDEGVEGRDYLELLPRAGGAFEDAKPLLRPETAALSAVLGSDADAWNLGRRLGEDFILCPHIAPAVPVPRALIRRGVELEFRPAGEDTYILEQVEHADG